MKIPLLLLPLLACCARRVPAREPSTTAPLPYCFRADVRSKPDPVTLAACAETMRQCNAVRELAARRGSLAGVISVGKCRTW